MNRQSRERAASGQREPESADQVVHDQVPKMQFKSSGQIPPVAMDPTGVMPPSASELAYRQGVTPAVQFRSKKRELPKGEEAFEAMREAFPQNYQEDGKDISSPDLLDEHGLPERYKNTCAVRISVMLNTMGENITPAKAKAAGVRTKKSAKTGQYYVVGAHEIWKYIAANFRAADVTFPRRGRYKDEEAFDQGYENEIKPAISGRTGIVGFDKYSTTTARDTSISSTASACSTRRASIRPVA
jgi:hypothetical protein